MIYFIQEGEDGAVKIGRSKTTQYRLKELQAGNPRTLRVLGVIYSEDALEKALHQRFSDDQVRGEWFKPTPALLAFIAAETEPWRPVRRQGGARSLPWRPPRAIYVE